MLPATPSDTPTAPKSGKKRKGRDCASCIALCAENTMLKKRLVEALVPSDQTLRATPSDSYWSRNKIGRFQKELDKHLTPISTTPLYVTLFRKQYSNPNVRVQYDTKIALAAQARQTLPKDPEANVLQRAIDLYAKAHDVYTKKLAPTKWTGLQTALAKLPGPWEPCPLTADEVSGHAFTEATGTVCKAAQQYLEYVMNRVFRARALRELGLA